MTGTDFLKILSFIIRSKNVKILLTHPCILSERKKRREICLLRQVAVFRLFSLTKPGFNLFTLILPDKLTEHICIYNNDLRDS